MFYKERIKEKDAESTLDLHIYIPQEKFYQANGRLHIIHKIANSEQVGGTCTQMCFNLYIHTD